MQQVVVGVLVALTIFAGSIIMTSADEGGGADMTQLCLGASCTQAPADGVE